MNIKKQELVELKKAGLAAISAKIAELTALLSKNKLEPGVSGKITRRSLARLLTLKQEMRSN